MKYPNILFDLTAVQPSDVSKRHGGAKYGEVVFRRILERHLPISCYYDSNNWINPDIFDLIVQNNIKLLDTQNECLEKIVEVNDIDILYTSLPTLKHIEFPKCRVIGTIHDVRSLEKMVDINQISYKPWKNIYRFILKKLFISRYRKKKTKYYEAAFNSPQFDFVTVSYHSANALKCYFPQYKDKKVRVYYSPSVSQIEISTIKTTEKYFLLVSAERYDKNVLRAIKALDRLFTCGFAPDYRVKITGAISADIFWYKIKTPERFDFVGFVDEKELAQLYHDAYCFIYPSLSEGFGYPPLEAMKFGVPVLASPFTAIPEICGGHVIYFNPLSVEEIMNRILLILQSNTHKTYSILAKERYAKITKKQNEDLDGLINYIYGIEQI